MATIPFEADESQAQRERKIKAAMVWLQEAMAGQERSASEMIAAAEASGIARTTLTTARGRLHIRSERRADGWHWIPAKSRKKQPATV